MSLAKAKTVSLLKDSIHTSLLLLMLVVIAFSIMLLTGSNAHSAEKPSNIISSKSRMDSPSPFSTRIPPTSTAKKQAIDSSPGRNSKGRDVPMPDTTHVNVFDSAKYNSERAVVKLPEKPAGRARVVIKSRRNNSTDNEDTRSDETASLSGSAPDQNLEIIGSETLLEFLELIDTNGDGIISEIEARHFWNLLRRIVNAGHGTDLIPYDLAQRLYFANGRLLIKIFKIAAHLRGGPKDATYREIAYVLCRMGIIPGCSGGTSSSGGSGGGSGSGSGGFISRVKPKIKSPYSTPEPSSSSGGDSSGGIGFLETDILDLVKDGRTEKIMSAADEAFYIVKNPGGELSFYSGKGDRDLDLAAEIPTDPVTDFSQNQVDSVLESYNKMSIKELAQLSAEPQEEFSPDELAGLEPAAGPSPDLTDRDNRANINGGMTYLRIPEL